VIEMQTYNVQGIHEHLRDEQCDGELPRIPHFSNDGETTDVSIELIKPGKYEEDRISVSNVTWPHFDNETHYEGIPAKANRRLPTQLIAVANEG
jgi:hypothetical protein